MPSKGKPTPGRGRDAGTGKYVPVKYAKGHPKTTVVEHDKSKGTKGGGKKK
jgi:hypothetical protein